MIKLENVSKFYKTEKGVSVGIQKINLEFKPGEFVALTGESGSGKSTLLNVMSGLDTYEEGELYINGEETSHYSADDWENYRNANIGFIFQNYNIIDSYTVLQNVVVALEIQGYEKSKIKSRALELIEQVGLLSHKNHKASKLSGGQKQRCVIARALAKDAPIIMADEPTGNLDSKTGKEILQLLHSISKNKLVIMVTHNFDEIKDYATRRINLFDGKVITDEEYKSVEEIEVLPPVKPEKMKLPQLTKFAFRNLLSTPKKLFFSVFVQTVIMLLILTIFANQIQSINSGVGMGMFSKHFAKQTEHRMVIQKSNKQPFSADEINKISKLDGVKDVIKNPGVFLDRGRFSIKINNINKEIDQHNFMPFATSAINPLSLHSGKLPENETEILLWNGTLSDYFAPEEYVNELRVGDSVKLTIFQFRSDNDVLFETELEFTVSGLLKDPLYNVFSVGFHKNFFENNETTGFIDDMTSRYINIYLSQYDSINQVTNLFSSNNIIVPNNKLTGRQVAIYAYGSTYDNFNNSLPFSLTYENAFNTYVANNLTYVPIESLFADYNSNHTFVSESNLGLVTRTDKDHADRTYRTIYVSDELFEEIRNNVLKNERLSVIVEDIVAGKKAIASINTFSNNSYLIFYNDANEDAFSNIQKIINQLATIILMSAVVSLGYAVIRWTQRNVMETRKRDFAVFRTMGANEKSLKHLLLIEQLLITIFCFTLSVITTTILSKYMLDLYMIYRHLTLGSYIFIFALLMIFSMLMGNRFNKKMFKETVMKSLNS